MIEVIRAYLVTLEEGSINRASRRLLMSQSALTRQIQGLEHEFGKPLFERGPWGVRPTDLGHLFAEKMQKVVAEYDEAWSELRQNARGKQQVLRVGYIGSAASSFLTPALAKLRKDLNDTQLILMDLTPGEQIEAIRAGRLDVALIGQEGVGVSDEFYTRNIASLGVCVAVAETHPLAKRKTAGLAEFADELFVGTSEEHVPGRNRWTEMLAKKAGFKVKYMAYCSAIDEVFALVAGAGAVSLVPDYFKDQTPSGTKLISLSDDWATWEFLVLRQRGNSHKAAKKLVSLIGG